MHSILRGLVRLAIAQSALLLCRANKPACHCRILKSHCAGVLLFLAIVPEQIPVGVIDDLAYLGGTSRLAAAAYQPFRNAACIEWDIPQSAPTVSVLSAEAT